MSSTNRKASEGEDGPDPASSESIPDSACAAANSAIEEFQKIAGRLSAKAAREAYARLMIGRGFDRVSGRATGLLPVGRTKPAGQAAQSPAGAAPPPATQAADEKPL